MRVGETLTQKIGSKEIIVMKALLSDRFHLISFPGLRNCSCHNALGAGKSKICNSDF